MLKRVGARRLFILLLGRREYSVMNWHRRSSAFVLLIMMAALQNCFAVEQPDRPVGRATQPFKLVGELDGSGGVAVAFSADGKRLVAANDRTCRVWDIKTLQPLTPPLQHGDAISQASIDRDGKYVLTCGDATEFRNGKYQLRGSGAKLWSVKTGMLLMDVPSHGAGHSVWSAALSPDGTHVATCAVDDPMVRVWDAVTGEPLLHFQTRDEAQFVMYNPDGTRLLTFWSKRAAAQQWDSRTGKPIGGELPSNADRSRHVIRPACYSADGKFLALANSDQLYVYDTQQNVEIASVTDNPIPSRDIFMSIDLTPDGRFVAATALGCGSQVWDAKSGQSVTDMLGGNGSNKGAISTDGK